jgi:hypothetical protein
LERNKPRTTIPETVPVIGDLKPRFSLEFVWLLQIEGCTFKSATIATGAGISN